MTSGLSDRARGALVAAAVLLLAFAFQGSRGIWEPDEGFYANCALGMAQSGDWLVPRLSGRPFLDKPPLVYWSIASGIELGGANEWAARAAHALWFAGTALAVGWLAGMWWDRRTGRWAALVYATMLVPFLAGNVLTPDVPLAFAAVLAWALFVRLERSRGSLRRAAWGLALGAALGLGALAKGPAILVVAAPMIVPAARRIWSSGRRIATIGADPGYLAAALVLVALALPWPLWVGSRLPGGLEYLWDNQVTGRLLDASYARNPGAFGGFAVYLPTLLIGSLPWALLWLRRGPGQPRVLARAFWAELPERPVALTLLVWFALPLAVFVGASSRLPLYVLPLFAPLALVTARRLTGPGGWFERGAGWPARSAFALWIVLLLALKLGAAHFQTPLDSRRLARQLRAASVAETTRIVTLDLKKNGLAFYGYGNLEPATQAATPYPFYSPLARLQEVVERMRRDRLERWFLVEARKADEVSEALALPGFEIREIELSEDYVLLEARPHSGQDGGPKPGEAG
jgi:4-amino-4-deoxy-L-arabinose transferase-like glycosyltransferase